MQLLLGDCLELMKDIPDGNVDMILCDLPYGTTACKWDTVIPFEPLWKQYKRVIKDSGAIVLFGGQPFTSALVMSNIKDFRYCWVWEKSRYTGHLNAKKRPLTSVEDIAVFSKKTATYNPQNLERIDKVVQNSKSHSLRGTGNVTSTVSGGIKFQKYTQEFTNYPHRILKFSSVGGTVHPTQKPVDLLEYLIRTYTNTDEVVVDNCMGSGSTGVACVNTGRKFIGIEQDEKYYGIAKERITAAIQSTIDNN
jgi:DNA modification methylase